MKKVKISVLVFLVCYIFSLFSFGNQAEASTFGEGYKYHYGYLSNGKYIARINWDYIDSSLANQQSSALSHWNSSVAKAYVRFQKTSLSKADITVTTVAKNVEWEPGKNVYGLACLYDNEGCWNTGEKHWFDETLKPQAQSKPGTIRYIKFCSIMLSRKLSGTSTTHKDYVLRHEMGHAIGLGHITPDSNIDKPLMLYTSYPSDPDATVLNTAVTEKEKNALKADIKNY